MHQSLDICLDHLILSMRIRIYAQRCQRLFPDGFRRLQKTTDVNTPAHTGTYSLCAYKKGLTTHYCVQEEEDA